MAKTIKGVEILKVGTWNATKFTLSTLKDILANFAKVDYEVPVILGHTRDPSAPAYGWVRNLRMQGNTLVADFEDVPDDLYKMIKAKQFRQVSVEVFFNLKRAGQTFKNALKAVALLGAHLPAVSGLKPVDAALNFDGFEAGNTLAFSHFVDEALAEWMEKNGADTVSFDLDILKQLSDDLYERAVDSKASALTFNLRDIPPVLLDAIGENFGQLSDKIKGEGVDGVKPANTDTFSDLVYYCANGTFPKPPEEVKGMEQLKILLSAMLATVGKKEADREAAIATLAARAKMQPTKLKDILAGKEVKLSDAEMEGLGGAIALGLDDGGGGDDDVGHLRNEVQRLSALLDNSDSDKDTIQKLEERLAKAEAKQREGEVEAKIKGVKIPALRHAIRGLYEFALANPESEVRLFSAEKKDFEKTTPEALVDELCEQLNQKAGTLFREFSQKDDDDRSNSVDPEDVGNEVDQKVQKYMKDHTEVKDYSVALSAVLDSDPDLKERYAAGGLQ